ncbi:DUF1799 domain-containing protein [Paraburkholderia sp. BL9I2N2]|uniref:DUF1799 domain-containing protein n=1 Tax=Paraburkholderia sp. BL9I2N2 TaxID=1938809 RepID=UPI0010E90C02|nr:DUF1799 domain-containing protein [Paraburkholderia sp. BL9I2N2]TCK96252.1 uncharacterized protein DUF1799 [Paraburkholderia sp. BL9I2N2]
MGCVPAEYVGSSTKKLIDAARRWAGVAVDDSRVDAGVAAALAAFGARPEDVERAREQQAENDFEVYPENWRAVQVFLALSTQWRTVAISTMTRARLIHTGLDYAAIEPVFRMMGIKPKRCAAIFQKLRVMEEAALDALLPE